MTRELKFRVWIGFKFLYSEEETGGFWGDVVLEDPELASRQQQFTGLKDKNGKEIYEGDILKNREGLILEIFWHPDGYWSWFENGFHMSEVVGSIYENPELLENL